MRKLWGAFQRKKLQCTATTVVLCLGAYRNELSRQKMRWFLLHGGSLHVCVTEMPTLSGRGRNRTDRVEAPTVTGCTQNRDKFLMS